MAKSDKRVKSLMDRLLSEQESKRDIPVPQSTPDKTNTPDNANKPTETEKSDIRDTAIKEDKPGIPCTLSLLNPPDKNNLTEVSSNVSTHINLNIPSGHSPLGMPETPAVSSAQETPDLMIVQSNHNITNIQSKPVLQDTPANSKMLSKSNTPDTQSVPINLDKPETPALSDNTDLSLNSGVSSLQVAPDTLLRVAPPNSEEELVPRTFKLPQSYLDIFDAYAYWERLEKQDLIGEIFFSYFRDKIVRPLPQKRRKDKRKRRSQK